MPLDITVDPSLAERLVAAAGLSGAISAIESLGGGMGSAVFGIRVGREDVVVKVYPEVVRASMRKELWVCGFLAERAPSLPVPKVLGVDESGSLIPQAFSVLTRLPGVYLRSLVPRLTDEELSAMYRQFGAVLRLLHEVVVAHYGEVMPGRGRRYRSNSEFMGFEFDRSLRDFHELGGEPQLLERLREQLRMQRPLLDECESPVLCHNDGHDANILVADVGGSWQLTGLLDFELALAGDPVLDLAKTYYFAPRRSEALLAALIEGYGQLDRSWRRRFDFYLLYHQLQLWNLLARLHVGERLAEIAADLEQQLLRAGG